MSGIHREAPVLIEVRTKVCLTGDLMSTAIIVMGDALGPGPFLRVIIDYTLIQTRSEDVRLDSPPLLSAADGFAIT